MAPKTENRLWVFLDESGAVRSNQAFVAGFWVTEAPEVWRNIVRILRRARNTWGELHFHEISRKPDDPGFLLAKDILYWLRHMGKWYARFIYVSEQYLQLWKAHSANRVYDFLVSQLCSRFLPHAKGRQGLLVIDEKKRPAWDIAIPYGLETLVNEISRRNGGPIFHVLTADSAEDDLLQVCDLLTAAMRQHFVPSGNENKEHLGRIVAHMRASARVKLWEWPSNVPTKREGASN